MKKAAVLLLVLFCAGAFAQVDTMPKIAVYVTGDLAAGERRALGAEMLKALLGSGRFSVGNTAAFVAEMEKTPSGGAVDDNRASQQGKQFGFRYVSIADVAAAFGSHQVSVRIIDVETRKVEWFGSASGQLNSMQALEAVSGGVVKSIFGVSTPAPIETVPAQSAPAETAAAQPIPAQTPPSLPAVAVYVLGDDAIPNKRLLASAVLDALLKSGQVTSIESNDAFITQLDGNPTKNFEEQKEKTLVLGRKLGARYVCIVDLMMRSPQVYNARAQLYDFESLGKKSIVTGESVTIRIDRNNTYNVQTIGHRLVDNMLGKIIRLNTVSVPEQAIPNYQNTERRVDDTPNMPSAASAPEPAVHSHQYGEISAVEDFTGWERAGTWLLNTAVPGVGSFLLMGDGTGAAVMMGTMALGYVGVLAGWSKEIITIGGYTGWSGRYEPNALFYIGVASFLTSGIYNIYRSGTYKKPASRRTATIPGVPQGLNLAVLPNADGNLKLYAQYRMEF